MKRHLAAAAAMLLCSATAAASESVRVRTGEHERFTRIALDLPAPLDWTLEADGDGALLRLQADNTTFDLEGAFRRIARDRIAALEPGAEPGTLRLALACDCRLETHLNGPRMLVIDVADAAPPIAKDQAPRPAARPWALPLLGRPDRADRDPPPASLPERPGPLPLLTASEGLRVAPRVEAKAIVAAPPPSEPSLKDAERRLAEELARAMSQGLLDPAAPPTARRAADQDAPGDGQTETDDRRARPGTSGASPDRAPLRAVTTLDAVQAGPGARPDPDTECLPARALDVAAWGDGTPFAEQLARARARLASYEKTPSTGAVTALARLYIHFGFGAEARAALRAVPIDPERRAVLGALAAVMDGEAEEEGPLAAQIACPDPGPLWAVLAASPRRGITPDTAASVRRSFAKLPFHLRRHLGPELADRLRRGGEHDAAHALLRALDRTGGPPDAARDLAAARLAADRGDAVAAEARLSAVIAEDGPEAPRALAELIRARAARGETVAPEMAERMSLYLREARGTPAEAALESAHVIALASSGAYRQAARHLEEAGWPGNEPAAAHVLERLAKAAPDAVFLAEAMTLSDAVAAALPPAIATAVGARLLDLGFPESAAPYLAGEIAGASSEDRAARAVARARLALATGRPERAEAELLGIAGGDAHALRAEARRRSGDYRGAREAYLETDRQTEATRAAWLAGDWDALAASDDAVLARTAQLFAGLGAEAGEDAGGGDDIAAARTEAPSLAASRAALARSAEARAGLVELLAHFALSEES